MTQKALHLGFFLNKSSFFVYIFKQNLDCMEKKQDKHPVVKLFLLERKHYFQKKTFLASKEIIFL